MIETKEFPMRKLLYHFIAVAVFLTITLTFFAPVFWDNKALNQHDVSQYVGASEDIRKYYNEEGESSEWTGGMFSGMPSYQIGVWGGSTNFLSFIEKPIKALGSTTAGPVFASMLMAYLLFILLGCNIPQSILGAVAYGFTSYNIIIIDAGHITKAWTLAYMPITIGGFLLLFKNKYIPAILCITIGLAMQIKSNHLQMTYYTGILGVILYVYFSVLKIKEKQIQAWIKVSSMLLLGVILALLANVGSIYANYEMSKTSTRGQSELTATNTGGDQKETAGLDKQYVFDWSYGVSETLTLMIPNAKGGASAAFQEDSRTMNAVLKMYQEGQLDQEGAMRFLQTFNNYWGDQPSTSGPVYFGAVVFFLFILGLTIIRNPMKWVLLASIMFFIFLSWGRNFEAFNDLFYYYFPLYSKFRAVSQALVIPALLVVVLAVWGLREMLLLKDRTILMKKLYWTTGILAGICCILWLFPDAIFSFLSPQEEAISMQLPKSLVSAMAADRRELLSADAFRSLAFIVLAAVLIWLWIRLERTKYISLYVCVLLAFLSLTDLWGVDDRYLPETKFVDKKEQLYTPSVANKSIFADKAVGHRVFNLNNPFAESKTSFFHRSIGGYHAAKLQRYQQLIERYLSPEYTKIVERFQSTNDIDSILNVFKYIPVLNMLDAKYIIYSGDQPALTNPYAMGNAWFVQKYTFVDNADAELAGLNKIDPATEAIIDVSFKERKVFEGLDIKPDSTASIVLNSYKPNILTYKTKTNSAQLAVFSEVYYENGWNAYIDGVKSPIFRADWILRAMIVPAGEHEIVFKFEPDSYRLARGIETVASGILVILVLAAIYFQFRRKEKVNK